MSERSDADELAERLLDESNADPDDDLRVLSRQLLRRAEVVQRLERRLGEMCDGTADLVNANRDTILRIHEEGLAKIRRLLELSLQYPAKFEGVHKALKIIDAVYSFHPMHGESWSGWPEGS